MTLQNAEQVRSKPFSLQIDAEISVVQGTCSSGPNGEPHEVKEEE